MFPTRCTRYFQLPKTEMRLRSELRRRNYRILNRLMDYQLQFRDYLLLFRLSVIDRHFFQLSSTTLNTLLSFISQSLVEEIEFPPRSRHRLTNLCLRRLSTSLRSRISGANVEQKNLSKSRNVLFVFQNYEEKNLETQSKVEKIHRGK